jgi:hypothetical protein
VMTEAPGVGETLARKFRALCARLGR